MKKRGRPRRQPAEKIRKYPAQRRSKVTVNAILEATFRILEKKNYGDISTTEIAKRAGVSVGTLYQYFRDKEGILDALMDHYVKLHLASLKAATKQLSGGPLEDYLAGATKVLLQSYTANINLSRVILGRFPISRFEKRRTQLDKQIREHIFRELEILELPIHHPRTEISVYVFTRSILGPIQAAVLENSTFLNTPEFAAALHWIVNASTELFFLRNGQKNN